MKKFRFFSLIIAALVMGLSFTSCEEDDSLLAVDDEENGEEQTAPELTVTEGGGSASTTVYVNELESGATEVDVVVNFTSTDDKMKRLYMTENIAGAGAEKYELQIEGLEKKGDGSVDLSGNEEYEFTFSIPFPVLSGMSEGTVEYQVWATSNRGDYRDAQKNLVAGPGTIVVNYGGTNPATVEVEQYDAKLLAAPLEDGSSETFISLADGQVYRIDQGEEYAAFWDFGYYYTGSDGASLASTSTYEDVFSFVDVDGIAGTTELNNCYFAVSEKDFDAVSLSSDLDDISTSSSQSINNLSVGDVIEFVDNYGKKGVIKVTEIEGTYNLGDYIKLDIKVQP